MFSLIFFILDYVEEDSVFHISYCDNWPIYYIYSYLMGQYINNVITADNFRNDLYMLLFTCHVLIVFEQRLFSNFLLPQL